jgi:hypothetical protein
MSHAFAGNGKELDKVLAPAVEEAEDAAALFAPGEQDEWEADMRAAWGQHDEDASL